MADGLRDIIIKIVPKLEDREYEKSLQELANNSASSMEKAFRNLDKTVKLAVREAGQNMDFKIDPTWQNQIDSYIKKYKSLQDFMRSTGRLPEGMDTKIYQSYQNLSKLTDEYYKTIDAAKKYEQELQSMPVEKISTFRKEVADAAIKVNTLEGQLKGAKEQADLFSKSSLLRGELMDKGYDTDFMMKGFTSRMQSIEALRAKIAELNTAEYTGFKTEEQKNAVIAQRTQLQTELANKEMMLKRTYGDDLTLLQQIYNVERQLTFDPSKTSILDINKQIIALENELKKAKRTWEEMLNTKQPEVAKYDQTSENFERSKERVKELEAEIIAAAQKTDELTQHADKTKTSFNQWRNAVWAASRVLGNVYTIGLDIVQGARKIANFYMRVWNAAKKVLGILKQWRKHITGTANEHAKSFKQMLKDIVRYSLGIRSLFALFRRLRGYIKEAFSAMAEQIPEVNAELASLKSSLYALKGSLATMLEPLLSAFATQLQAFIDLLAKAITYVGMFFAALTGRAFVYKANKVAQTIGKAAGAAKELNKQLQGFDELNNLTSDKGGGGGGGDTPLAQFEKVDVPKWIKDLAQALKDLWDRIIAPIKEAWAKVGDYVVAAWKRAFNSVKDLLHDIGRDFLTVWDKMGEHIAEQFFLIIGDVGNIIANIADKIREAWNFVEEGQTESNGIRFWTAILSIVDAILTGVRKITLNIRDWTANINITPAMTAFVHWLESLVPITEMVMEILYQFWDRALKPILTWAFDGENSGVARFFQILADFNDSLDKEKIIEDLNKIWDAIGRFGINIGEGLLIFMERMLGYLSDWLNSDDFTEWCQKVADFLDGLKPEDLADDLEQVWRIIKNIAEWTWKAISYVIEHKDQILDALEKASEHLDVIAAIFLGGKLAIDVARFAANVALAAGAFGKFVSGISAAAGVIGPVAAVIAALAVAIASCVAAYGGLEGTIAKIKSVAKDVSDTLAKVAEKFKLSEKIQKLKDSFDKLLTSLGLTTDKMKLLRQIWDLVFEALSNTAKGLGTYLLGAFNSFTTMLSGVIQIVTSIIENIKGIYNLFVGAITGDTERMKQGIDQMWEAIKSIFSGAIDFIVGLCEGLINLILAPFYKIKYELVGDPIVVDMWEEIKRIFSDSIGKVVEFVTNFKDDVIELFQKLKEKIDEKIKDIKDKFKEFADDVKQKKEDISNKIKELKDKVIEHFNNLKQKVNDFKTDWVNKFNDIKQKVNDFKTDMDSKFTSIKDSVIKAIEGIKDGIKSPINSIIGFFEKMVNGIIDGFNGLGSKLNDFEFDIPDALAEKFNLPSEFNLSIPKIPRISIPRLAQGAVIPPNKEFLAVLGDQKRGTNIEAPLDTMVQAFNMANRGGNEQELRLLQEQNDLLRQLLNKEFGISERQIYNSVINQDNIRRKSTGYSAFAY